MSNITIRPVTPRLQHGEGPHYAAKENALYICDTFQSTLYKFRICPGLTTYHKLEGRNSIGTVTPIKDATNQFVVSSDRFLYHLEWDGKGNNTGRLKELYKVEENKPDNQFNDGKFDVNGNLWIGTLTRQKDLDVTPKGGSLYRISLNADKKSTIVEEKIAQTSISNGLAWSKDNRFFFYIDSDTRTVEKYDFDHKSGKIENKRILFDLSKYPDIKGIPDGMTIDTDDNLWVCMYGGWSILNVDSKDGTLLYKLTMPVQYVTSAVFAGKDMSTLYATTSRLKLTREEEETQKSAGCVFEIKGLRSRGLSLYDGYVDGI